MNAAEMRRLLPWDAPFLMLDRTVALTPHESIVAVRGVSAGDASGGVWFPALLLLEGLAQAAALLYRVSYGERAAGTLPKLGFLRASLHGTARAGERIEYHVRAAKMTSTGGIFEGRAQAEGVLLAEAELGFMSGPTP